VTTATVHYALEDVLKYKLYNDYHTVIHNQVRFNTPRNGYATADGSRYKTNQVKM
jgi:hypothetical protein